MKKLPVTCPACSSRLQVKQLVCDNCHTSIDGQFDLPPLARLSREDQAFLLEFIKFSGSLKDIAASLGLSYPTVRNMLNDIISRIESAQAPNKENSNG